MDFNLAIVILIAAVLHASWNALIKVSGDRIAVMALVTAAGSTLSLFALPFIQPPEPAVWPLLSLSILIHTGYHFFLPLAYDHGDLGQVYPIARGSAPILVTLGALIFAGEIVSPIVLLGVISLSAGVLVLTFDKTGTSSLHPKTVLFALATGTTIAAYTLVDGMGARSSGSVLGFAVWLTIGNGLLTFFIALIWKKKVLLQVARANLGLGLAGGAMQIGAYWIIIWALAIAPMGMVSAMRETSVLFAALISTFLLKEGFGVWRFVSAGLVTFGLILNQSQK